MISIINKNNHDALKKFSHLPWSYIGEQERVSELETILNPAKRFFVGRELNEVRTQHADHFVDFIGQLSVLQQDLVLWYSSPMASKSISQTRIFHYYVYIKWLERYALTHNHDMVLVVNDDDFIHAVSQMGFLFINAENGKHPQVGKKIRGWLKIGKYVCLWIISRLLPKSDLSNIDALLHTWVDARTFNSLPKMTDSYLVDSADYLVSKGMKVARISLVNIKFNLLFKLKRFFPKVIFPLEHIGLSELISTLMTPFKFEINDDFIHSRQDGKVLSVLLKLEARKENDTKLYLDYLMLHAAYSEINERLTKPVKFVYSFENQPWEKMLNLAFPKHHRIAFQHAAIPHYWMDYNFSPAEDKKILPQVILSSGPYWSDFLREKGFSLPIDLIGGLRYEYLFHIKPSKADSAVIVVALPIDKKIAAQLLLNILRALKTGIFNGYNLKIKSHPYVSTRTLGIERFKQFSNCEFSTLPMSELLGDCHLLISSESTTLFEGAFAGIRTISFTPEDVTFGLGEMIRESICIAYEDDFIAKVKMMLAAKTPRPLDVYRFFSKPDYAVMGKYALAAERELGSVLQ